MLGDRKGMIVSLFQNKMNNSRVASYDAQLRQGDGSINDISFDCVANIGDRDSLEGRSGLAGVYCQQLPTIKKTRQVMVLTFYTLWPKKKEVSLVHRGVMKKYGFFRYEHTARGLITYNSDELCVGLP